MAATALLLPGAAGAGFEPVRVYEEVADPPTPVRGHAVVGVAVAPAAAAMQSDSLWVRPGSTERDLSVRADLASANGRLRGEGTWKFNPKDGATGPWYRLAAPTKVRRPDRPEHLSLAVQPQPNDPAVPVFILAALGNEPPKEVERVRIYVNTRRAEMFAYPPGVTDPAKAARCTPIEGAQAVRFDAVCDIRLAPGASEVTLVRRDGHQTSRQKIAVRW